MWSICSRRLYESAGCISHSSSYSGDSDRIMKVELQYEVRKHFKSFHARDVRWAVLVFHRRAGKTVAVVNDLIEKAAYNTRKNPRYGYIAPLYNQAKQIAWQYLKDYAAPFNPKISESGLFVELPHNGARITLYGADNPDSFRGLYFDGVALDEFGNMRNSIFTEVLLPALIDRRGWAVFMGTPNGPNHFRDMYEDHKGDKEWHVELMPYQLTDVIPLEDIEQIRKLMTEEEFQQEMECNFAASTRGAFYSKEIALAEADGRVKELEFDTSQPLHWVLDLGWRDDTALIAFQERPDGYPIMFSASENRRAIPYYINVIQSTCDTYACARGNVWLPHDAKAKSLQTGRSIVEQFMDNGILPEIVPELSIMDGISAARMLFGDMWFNEPLCKPLIMALKSYHREFDEDKKMFRDNPVHDWSSHFADTFRYLSLVINKIAKKRAPTQQESMEAERKERIRGAHYAFNLQDLWEHNRSDHSRRDNWRM